jgi:hypothetical protein
MFTATSISIMSFNSDLLLYLTAIEGSQLRLTTLLGCLPKAAGVDPSHFCISGFTLLNQLSLC